MNAHPLVVVGIGHDGPAGLSREAREHLAHAAVLAGGRRHLDFFPDWRGDAHQDPGGEDEEEESLEREPGQERRVPAGVSARGEAEQGDRRAAAEKRRRAEHVQEERHVPAVGADRGEHQAPGFQIITASTASVTRPLP